MTKMYLPERLQTLFTALLCFVAISSLAMGDDRFAVTVGAHDHLVIFGPKGERISELAVPSIAQPITIGDVSFQVSYGCDANGQLTAILTPSSTDPVALHFTVLGKSVDADKAVVTLTFSSNLKGVTIDPGYVGSVEVNSHRLRQHHLADDAPVLPVVIPSVSAAPALAPDSVAPVGAASPSKLSVVSNAPPASSPETAPSAFPRAPAPLASQLTPSLLAQDNSDSAPAGHADMPKTASVTSPAAAIPAGSPATDVAKTTVKLYWSEPVTPPNGPAPSVGLDEIKLLEVHGPVSVTLTSGEIKTGVEGMMVPSGSKVATFDNASAALFMGGVNSARLMPNCELTVTQSFDGTVRKTLLDLEHGAVFSRVGRRAGEVEDFKVRTAEGVMDATTPDMLAFRGSLDELQGKKTAMNLGRGWNRKGLLAWSPFSMGRNLISDQVDPMFGGIKTIGPGATGSTPPPPVTNTYFYLATNVPGFNLKNIKELVLSSYAGAAQNSSFSTDSQKVLQAILVGLQPFNFKLHDLLYRFNSGTGTPGDIAFYKNLITVFFDTQIPSIDSEFSGSHSALIKETIAAAAALKQDLQPFGTTLATPY